MAWGDLAKVGELLASLSSFGSAGKKGGKAHGKGDKYGKGGNPSLGKKFCQWSGCTAAEKHHATVGGSANCHSCRRPFANNPPLERLVEWAFKEKLKAPPTTNKGGGKGQKGLGQGSDKDQGKSKGKAEPTARS